MFKIKDEELLFLKYPESKTGYKSLLNCDGLREVQTTHSIHL